MKNNVTGRLYIVFTLLCSFIALVLLGHFLGNLPLRPDTPMLAFQKYGLEWPLELKCAYLGVLAFVFLALIFNPFRTGGGLYGSSHFATEKEIKSMGLRGNDGLILGKKSRNYLRVSEPKSVLIFAPPGTGKTAAIVIPSLLASADSTVTYDPKGELLEKTGPYRSQFSTVKKFAPGEADSLSWNPLAKEELPSQWSDIEVHINRIVECLMPYARENEPSHWTDSSRRLFTFWALFLVHTKGETSFYEIMKSALSEDAQGAVGECLLEKDLPERIHMEGNTIVTTDPKEFSSVLNTFTNGMRIFMDPRVAENTTKSDIQINQLRHERTSLYLVVSNQDSKRLKPILTLFFELTANSALAKEPSEQEMGITLFLDELVRLGRMDEVKRVPAIGRSYRLRCVFVVQTLAQLRDIYGPDGADEFMGTCSYMVFFTQNEPKVAQMLSQAIGNMTVKTSTKSGKMMQTKSVSEGETGIPLVRPEDILSLPFGDLLILTQSYFSTPIAAKGAYWFKESSLKKCVAFSAATEAVDESVEEVNEQTSKDSDSDALEMAPISPDLTSAEEEQSEIDAFSPADEAENIEAAFDVEEAPGAWSDADLGEEMDL